MSTNRQEISGVSVRADMGTQYLSCDAEDPVCSGIADLLIREGACLEIPSERLSQTPERPSGPTWRHLAGAHGGVNDALKALLRHAMAEPHYEKRVASLDAQQGKWRARPFEGALGLYDAVVLAVPGSGVGGGNLSKIHGNWKQCVSAQQNRCLTEVEYDHRWSFALFLPLDCAAMCDQFFGPELVEKAVDNTKVHLLCYQSRKAALLSDSQPDGAVVVVAHSTLDWARKNARVAMRDQRVLHEMADAVGAILRLDRGISSRLLASKAITWRQCQVTRPVSFQMPDGSCMRLSDTPPLVLAGDYFTESSFAGCLKSGVAAATVVAKLLRQSKGESPAVFPESAAYGISERSDEWVIQGKAGSREGVASEESRQKDGGKVFHSRWKRKGFQEPSNNEQTQNEQESDMVTCPRARRWGPTRPLQRKIASVH